ncbi:uncharacterized protein LOC118755498, partial [Rhagoletis pomonella]|uniref:uncharacterized protein LOC118755498 n=1 Tax=Rhagoletis pomonella TaxID=28610 RepID=UPI00177DAEFD
PPKTKKNKQQLGCERTSEHRNARTELKETESKVLYHEIVSHARVVSACIRAASEKHQGQVYLQQQQEEEQQLQSFDSCGTTIAEQSNSSLTSNEEEPPATKEATGEGEQASDELSSDSSSSGIETAEKSSLSPRKSSARSATGSPELAESSSKIVEDSLDRLQNRYHLLYLKAFEVQLWLDGLLRKKSSTASIADAADYDDGGDDIAECNSSDDEEEAAATEDDLNILGSGIESDITHNSSSVCELQNCPDLEEGRDCDATKGDCADGDDEGEEDEDDIQFGRSRLSWPVRGNFSTVLVTFDKRGSFGDAARATTLTDFEADSENSDWETTQRQVSTQRKPYNATVCSKKRTENEVISINSKSFVTPLIGEESANNDITLTQSDINTSATAPVSRCHQAQDAVDGVLDVYDQREIASANASSMSMKTKMNNSHTTDGDEQQMLVPMSASSTVAANVTTISNASINTISTATQTQQKLQTLHNNKQVGAPIKQKSIAVISPNNSHNNKSPTVLRKRQQQHHTDISKFNRSNRKSKNCAVFYFKHLDTDNETNCSSFGDAADADASGGQPDGRDLSSSTSQTSEHHLLKSADASSDDDGGWLYSSVLPPPQSNEVTGEWATEANGDKNNSSNSNS